MISNYFCNKNQYGKIIVNLINAINHNPNFRSLHYGSKFCANLSENSEAQISIKKPIDPLILKYNKMLDDLEKSQTNDHVYKTNFGSVRFDVTINPQNMHKNFITREINEDDSNTKYVQQQDQHMKSDTPLNYIDEVYFSDSISNTPSSDSILEYEKIKENKFKNLNDLNYIDEQFMVTASIENREVTNRSDDKTDDISVNNFQDSDLNYIDSQLINLSNQNNIENVIASEDVKNQNYNKSNKLDKRVNDLDVLYRFEDSIIEETNDNVVTRLKSQNQSINEYEVINNELRRNALEEQLLSMTEKGNEILDKVDSDIQNKKFRKEKFGSLEGKEDSKSSPDNEISSSSSYKDLSKKPKIIIIKKMSAYDYIKNQRNEEKLSSTKVIKGEILPHEWYKKIIVAVPTYSQHTQYDLAQELRKNILYNNNDIVAICKPYGIASQGGGGNKKVHDRLNLVTVLPTLAELIKEKNLYPVHRLDLQSTGVMLFAKTNEMADTLKQMLKEHKIKKTYLAITKGIPDPLNGIIDIPVGEGKVDRFERMVLRPDIPGFRGKSGKSKKAITRYKVLSTAHGCALLEVNPITGVKHQIRVHLGFGINCPVFGDPKYSFLDKIAPQKLPSGALNRLGIKQSTVRALPLHLHSFCVNIPIYDENGRDIYIRFGPPKFFKTTLQALQLSGRRNRLSNDYSDLIYGYE